MSLRKKTLLIVGMVLIGTVAFSYISARLILLDSYFQLEDHNMRENTQRAMNVWSNELEVMHTATQDWAHWTDTYNFMQRLDETFLLTNMTDNTFIINRLNAMLLVNTVGEVVYSKGFDFATQREVPVSSNLLAQVSPDSLLVHPQTAGSDAAVFGLTGFLLLPEGPVALTVVPILRSDRTGTPQGVMIWARYWNETVLRDISNKAQLSIQMYRLDSASLPDAVQKAHDALSDQNSLVIERLNQDRIASYSLINDILEMPAFLVRIDMPREIHAQAQQTLKYFWQTAILIGVIFALVSVWMLERIILSPIARLDAAITHVRQTDDLSTPVKVSGSDEIADLAKGMNEMLEALAQSRDRLQEAHDQLEQRVAERTAELSEANTQLTQEIAERWQAQAMLAMARDQAIEALRMKSQILANISHDARTPLSIITLRAEIMERGHYGPITEKQNDALGIMLLSARQLIRFFDNLLGEAQLDSRQLKVIQVDFSPAKLLEEAQAVMLPLAERKGLQMKTDLSAELPPVLYGDPERLKQVVINLVDNAIKFTPQGSVTLQMQRSNSKYWMLQVSDTGIGIPGDAHSRIFEAFWQVDGSMTREISRGVGLGLSIVKQLVTLMGGQVTVKSEVGVGSTFTVILPIVEKLGEPVNA